MSDIVVNATPRETRIALLEQRIVTELFIELRTNYGLVGNIYRGRVVKILPGMQAAFVDIGSSFNLRTNGDQSYSSEFLTDQPFLQTVGFIPCPRLATGVAPITLSSAVFCVHPQFAVSPFFSLVARDNHLVSQAELDAAQTGILDPATQMPFGFQPVFVRGEVQTNTVARLGESKFAGIGDFHTSYVDAGIILMPLQDLTIFRLFKKFLAGEA